MSRSTPFLPLLLWFFLSAPSMMADRTETAGGQTIVGGSATATYYAPALIYSLNNQYSYLYVQGDHTLLDGTATQDSVYFYRNPLTWTGLTTSYSYVRTLLPDAGQGHGGSYLYGGPSVCTDGSK